MVANKPKGASGMGEYAEYQGQQVKIGTCEDMYYLRADQASSVTALPGNVDPTNLDDLCGIRFRFPFPDEDGIEPGMFDRYDRSVQVYGITAPGALRADHYSVQFKADAGYLVSLPCPESGMFPESLKVARNGFVGAVRLVQQRYWAGALVGVVQCACGLRWRLETLEDAQPAIESLNAEADRREHQARVGPHFRNEDGSYDEDGIAFQGQWYRRVAERLEDGYRVLQIAGNS